MPKTLAPQPRPVGLVYRLLSSDAIVPLACMVAVTTALWFA